MVLFAGAFLCAGGASDPDLWGHLTFGRDILRDRAIATVDPYSFTQDQPWVNHEWLSELLFAAVHGAAGVAGLIVLKTAVLLVTLLVAWRLLSGVRPEAWKWALLALVVFVLGPAALSFRPQLWSLLGTALLVALLRGRAHLLWTIPLFVAWANLHGGWIVGAGLFSAWLFGRALDGVALRSLVTPSLILGTAVVATLINPYGVGLWEFLAATVRMTRDITEWKPVWEQLEPSKAILWGLSTTAFAVTLARRWGRLSFAWLIPATGLCVAALLVSRLGPMYALVCVPVWGDGWANDETVLETRGSSTPPNSWVVDVAGVTAVWLVVAGAGVRCLPITGYWIPDLRAAAALDTPAATGRLALPFNWGQYAIWHWGPRLKVSIDGRRETVFSERMLALQAKVWQGQPEGIDYLGRERPEYVWLERSADSVRSALAAVGYRIDVLTDTSFIAVREDLPTLVAREPKSACFP
jgi:hypothetical protein